MMEKLRFKNSYGKHSEIKSAYLGEVAQIKTGDLNVQDSSENGAYPFFDRSVDIKRLDVYSYDKEAIIYPGEGSEFYPRLYRGKFALHQRAYAIFDFNKDVNLDYIYQYLKTKNNHFITTAVGSTVKSLRMDCFEKCKVKLPNYEEQEKIGGFLSSFDKLIQKQQEKIGLLKELKKGYLQQMFPNKGSNIPKIRFKRFTDTWEQCELNQLTDIYDGTHQTPNYTDSGIMFLSVENISTLKSNKFISEEAFLKEFKIYPQKDDILMTRIGDIGTANIVCDSDPKAYYVSLALLKNIKLDPHFLKESIASEHVKKELWHRTLHIAFPKKINKNEIAKIRIFYPKSNDEQIKIGKIFNYLENLITLHQNKLKDIEELKKGYMQRLFAE